LLQRFLSSCLQINAELDEAYKLQVRAYRAVGLELGETLAALNFDIALELVRSIEHRHQATFEIAKGHMEAARQMLEQAK